LPGWAKASSPRELLGNVRTAARAYARYKELHGTIRLGNRTMIEALHRAMTTNRYDIKRERMPDSPDEYTDYRITTVKRIIGDYREAAQRQLLRENPELHKAVVVDKRNRAAAKRGKLDQLQSIF
jgi:hypothetical protein